jgi:antitoxin FitA
MLWRQNGAILLLVPSVQIKNVPQDVHRVLRRRAADAGQSLQEYLRARIVEEARRPTLEETLARVEQRSGGEVSLSEAVKAVRADRDKR